MKIGFAAPGQLAPITNNIEPAGTIISVAPFTINRLKLKPVQVAQKIGAVPLGVFVLIINSTASVSIRNNAAPLIINHWKRKLVVK